MTKSQAMKWINALRSGGLSHMWGEGVMEMTGILIDARREGVWLSYDEIADIIQIYWVEEK